MRAREGKPVGPGTAEIVVAAILSVLLGLVLGAAILALQPVAVVKELPAAKDRPRGTVYHIPGKQDSSKGAEALRKRQLFMGGQSISLSEEELNLLFAPPATGSAGRKESKNEVVIGGLFAVGEPNVRLADGVIQLAAPVRLVMPDVGVRFIVQIRGTMARDRKSTRLNSSHVSESRMPSSA